MGSEARVITGVMQLIPRRRGIIGALEAIVAPHTARRVEVFSGGGNDLARLAALFDAPTTETPVSWYGTHTTAIPDRPVVIKHGDFVTKKRPSRLHTTVRGHHVSEAHGDIRITSKGILQGWNRRKDGRIGLVFLDATVTPTSRSPVL